MESGKPDLVFYLRNLLDQRDKITKEIRLLLASAPYHHELGDSGFTY